MIFNSRFHVGQWVHLGPGRDQLKAVVTSICFRGSATSAPTTVSIEVAWFAGGIRYELWMGEWELASYNGKENMA